ncbi:hypothetical protein CTEN210_12849 [Chaetoceros tenuissimus]|uniref:Fatty acyl-CoA reductase n=1 Tax=Chaetoceros tenuissimus TaxID=426638 RepID=A0AAD3HAW7_9STRA|nr:hypothetical protein CTEN210_12849 [Chaetoceros tenuissimus]
MISNTNVLLIGATGFIGKVTLGMLLERMEVQKVYILIRPKVTSKRIDGAKIANIRERFQQLKQNPCLQSKACQKAFAEGRVIPIAGDLSKERLGICKDDYERLTMENSDTSSSHDSIDAVTHIINLAADVGFDQTLLEAIENNVDTALNVFALAKKCKFLINFVHCSTAYVAPTSAAEREVGNIKEELHESSTCFSSYGDADAIYTLIKKKGLTKLEEEKLLKSAARPSIVSVSLHYPAPGWTDSRTAVNGPVLLFAEGFLHTNIGNEGSLYDIIPCDYVADCLINAVLARCDVRKVKVIHITAGKENCVDNASFIETMEDFWNPRKRKAFILRPFYRSNKLDLNKSISLDQKRLLRLKRILVLTRKEHLANKLEKIVPLLQKTADVHAPFQFYRYDFISGQSIHDFEPTFNPVDYAHLICQGIHYYLLRHSEDSPDNPKPKYRLSQHMKSRSRL